MPMPSEPGPRAPDKLRHGHPAPIRQHFHVGQARGIVHGHVHELPADAPHLGAAISRDAVSDAADPAELLDVEMQQIAGLGPLIALDGPRRFAAVARVLRRPPAPGPGAGPGVEPTDGAPIAC